MSLEYFREAYRIIRLYSKLEIRIMHKKDLKERINLDKYSMEYLVKVKKMQLNENQKFFEYFKILMLEVGFSIKDLT